MQSARKQMGGGSDPHLEPRSAGKSRRNGAGDLSVPRKGRRDSRCTKPAHLEAATLSCDWAKQGRGASSGDTALSSTLSPCRTWNGRVDEDLAVPLRTLHHVPVGAPTPHLALQLP